MLILAAPRGSSLAEQRRPAEESRYKSPAGAALHTPTSRVSALGVSRTVNEFVIIAFIQSIAATNVGAY